MAVKAPPSISQALFSYKDYLLRSVNATTADRRISYLRKMTRTGIPTVADLTPYNIERFRQACAPSTWADWIEPALRAFCEWATKTYPDYAIFIPPKTTMRYRKKPSRLSAREAEETIERVAGVAKQIRLPQDRLLFLLLYVYQIRPKKCREMTFADILALPMRRDLQELVHQVERLRAYTQERRVLVAFNGPHMSRWSHLWGEKGFGTFKDILRAGAYARLRAGIRPKQTLHRAIMLVTLPELNEGNVERIKVEFGD